MTYRTILSACGSSYQILTSLNTHGKRNVFLTKFSSLAAPEVDPTTSAVGNAENFVKMTTFPFQCIFMTFYVQIKCRKSDCARPCCKLHNYRKMVLFVMLRVSSNNAFSYAQQINAKSLTTTDDVNRHLTH